MRIAVLGGSFNPLHLGHLFLADEVYRKLGYDCILFVPAWQPPHKDIASGATTEQRLEMLKDAILGIKHFACDNCEICRKGVSYTIDTIKYLEEKYQGRLDGKIGLIIGDDLIDGFSKWKSVDELTQRCDIILANRLENDKQFTYPHIRIDNVCYPVSSTDIRSRIKDNRSWRFFVPETVYRYIKANKLFECIENEDESSPVNLSKTASGKLSLSTGDDILALIERVRKYAMAAEKAPRYEHSVRVAETAAQMCRLYGENDGLGYLAGLAHDICKDMSDKLLLSIAVRDGNPLEKIERDKPALLHGRAAAVLLQSDFAISNQNVLEAVRCHTFGRPGLSNLAKIIYAADKIEPGREHVTPEYLKRLFAMSLDGLVGFVLQENIDYLESKGKAVAPVTRRFLQSICSDL